MATCHLTTAMHKIGCWCGHGHSLWLELALLAGGEQHGGEMDEIMIIETIEKWYKIIYIWKLINFLSMNWARLPATHSFGREACCKLSQVLFANWREKAETLRVNWASTSVCKQQEWGCWLHWFVDFWARIDPIPKKACLDVLQALNWATHGMSHELDQNLACDDRFAFNAWSTVSCYSRKCMSFAHWYKPTVFLR